MSNDAAGLSLSSRLSLSLESLFGAEGLLDGLRGSVTGGRCSCEPKFDGERLSVDATGCDGDLATAAACRQTVVEALVEQDAEEIRVQANGLEYRYGDDAVRFLAAAGRFIKLLGDREPRLARTAASDPLAAAAELRSRTGPLVDIAAESGLLHAAEAVDDYETALSPTVSLSMGYYLVDHSMGEGAKLRDVTQLETGSEARIYERGDGSPLYVLDVLDVSLSAADRELLVAGYEAIANGVVEGDRAPIRAIEHVSDGSVDPTLSSVLEKHTRGYGVLEDLFADPRVTDVFATSPVESNPLRVVVDGESMATNVRLSTDGAKALASRVRRTSGRAFSRASPTVDATASLENGTGLRIAGVTHPVADGVAFAFRERADERFTLPALIENGTLPVDAAAFLSVAVERNAAALIAGTRGAGKTTLLGTLLYELAPDTRTVVIEDTPELPVDSLQSVDRDVQALRTGTGGGPEISPAAALRTALRMGDGALVVGEIRGEEARVLYEAMRVGANADAVLGTIHGDGAEEVYERVVSDLGVEESSFAATDLVVTVQVYRTPDGRRRRLAAIEEVVSRGGSITFEPLYEIEGETATPTGRVERGGSRLIDRLAGPGETYADVREDAKARAELLETLEEEGRITPPEVDRAYAGREAK